jgi:uncharacterized protein YciI
MGLFAVMREAGPAWTDDVGAFEQPSAGEHAAFMNGLAGDGFLLFAGPLGGSEAGRIRVLLIAEAADEAEITQRLAHDPWAIEERLVTASVESWLPVLGAEGLPVAQDPESTSAAGRQSA